MKKILILLLIGQFLFGTTNKKKTSLGRKFQRENFKQRKLEF